METPQFGWRTLHSKNNENQRKSTKHKTTSQSEKNTTRSSFEVVSDESGWPLHSHGMVTHSILIRLFNYFRMRIGDHSSQITFELALDENGWPLLHSNEVLRADQTSLDKNSPELRIASEKPRIFQSIREYLRVAQSSFKTVLSSLELPSVH